MSMDKPDYETEGFRVLRDMQRSLSMALKDHEGTSVQGEVTYVLWNSYHLSQVVQGYCELREKGMIYASKLLIRPALETTAAALAAVNDQGFLFRKAFSEFEERRKLLTEYASVFKANNEPTDQLDNETRAHQAAFTTYEQEFAKQYPGKPRQKSPLTSFAIMQLANMGQYYAQYRIYCQFTHGALDAMSGELDASTDKSDTMLMCNMTFKMLEVLANHASVKLPQNMAEISKRFVKLVGNMSQ